MLGQDVHGSVVRENRLLLQLKLLKLGRIKHFALSCRITSQLVSTLYPRR